MRLSRLQKYILETCFEKKYSKLDRQVFLKYYNYFNQKTKKADRVNIITKSLERLIKNGLAAGFGELTQKRTYINKIKLTPKGREEVKKFFGQQRRLPL